MNLRGHSGAELVAAVVKRSVEPRLARRIEDQARRFGAFARECDGIGSPLTIPSLLMVGNGSFAVEMVQPGTPLSELPDGSEQFSLARLHLRLALGAATPAEVSRDGFAASIYEASLHSEYCRAVGDRVLRLLDEAPPLCPVGVCHGDYTMDNLLLASDGGVVALDFGSPPVPTPLLDLAKWRQDVRYGWAAHRRGVPPPSFWSGLDMEVQEADEAWLRFLQPYTLMRVLSHAKEERDVAWATDLIWRLT